MISIPSKIRIGAHEIEVRIDDDVEDACGYFESDKLLIVLSSELPESLLFETFWHEVVEAINHFAECDLEHKSIQVMGLMLHQVIQSILSPT